MSLASTAALQTAVYSALMSDAQLASLTGGAIFDALPPGPVPTIYVSLGPERVRDASDVIGDGSMHDFPVTVISAESGFQSAKEIAVAISDALMGSDLTLSRGTLVSLNFTRSRARRVGDAREIEIWFRALIDSSAA